MERMLFNAPFLCLHWNVNRSWTNSFNLLLMVKPKKYYYITEIEECVLCGKEKSSRYRVKEKPKSSILIKQYACDEHFI